MAGHVHEVAYDVAVGPDHAGRLQVTEHCACHAVVGSYTDSVL